MTVTLHCGDCLDILPTLDANSVDAIITDLPYGTTACKWDVVIPFAPMWEQVKRILKPRGAFVTTASQPFTSLLVCSNLAWFKYELIWDRKKGQNFVRVRKEPMKSHENIVVFSETYTAYTPQMQPGEPYKRTNKHSKLNTLVRMGKSGGKSYSKQGTIINNGTRFPKSIMHFSAVDRNRIHPTQKPVALYEYLIRTYTNEGDTVLDFCMGSCTTGVAAVQLGRSFIGVELDPDYFKIAEKRIAAAMPTEIELLLFAEVLG